MLVCCCVFVARGHHDELLADHQRDFKQPYASARCLLDGCDPYSEKDTRLSYLRAGGINDDPVVFDPYSALYPPFSLALLVPIAALPYPIAQNVWLWLCGITFSIAVMLTTSLCLPYDSRATIVCLGVFVLTSTILLMEGQVSGLAIGLMVIGIWCFLRERYSWLAVICLAAATALKPNDVPWVLLYLALAGPLGLRIFSRVLVLTAIIVTVGCTWCYAQPASRGWLAEWSSNLAGNSGPGGVNQPVRWNPQAGYLVDLQAVLGALTSQPHVYTAGAWLITAVIFLLWLIPVLRMRNTKRKHLVALAGIACITLLPVYHRQYDTRLLLLVFPAVAMLASSSQFWGRLAQGLAWVATVASAYPLLRRLLDNHPSVVKASAWKTIVLYRPLPMISLVLAIFFVSALFSASADQRFE